jgi:hypothetical protein
MQSTEFCHLFTRFIDSLMEANYAEDYLKDSTSVVSRAYQGFLRLANDMKKQAHVVS